MKVGQCLSKHLERSSPVVSSARSGVHAVGYGVEFVLRVDRPIGALGQVLTQQPVGVLAGTALPRAVRVAEIDPHAGGSGQVCMARHLLALVVGQALAHGQWDRIQLGSEARQCRSGSGVMHARQQHQAARTLDQHARRELVAGALDEVAFPVPWHHAVIYLGRAHVDVDHVGDLPAPVGAAAARQPRAATLPQAGQELAAQLAPGLGIDGGVDGFVGHVALGLAGEHALETGGTAPASVKRPRTVACVAQQRATVALHLAADGGGRARKHAGYSPRAFAHQLHARNHHALFRLQLLVDRSFVHRSSLQESGVALQI